MKIAELILQNRKLILSVTAIFAFLGAVSWMTMSREEDPRMAERYGMIQVIYPGATPENVEAFVAKPLEDEIVELEDVKWIETTVRSEVAIVYISLKSKITSDTEINESWRDVEEAMDTAAAQFPDGILSMELDRKMMETDGFVLAIGGDKPLLELKQTAEDLKDALLSTALVSRVRFYANPGEQITISISDLQASRLGLSYFDIANQLNSANQSLAAGSIRQGARSLSIQTNSSFKTVEEVRAFPILTQSGQTVPLGNLARVEKTIELPPQEVMTYNSEKVVGLGVVPQKNSNLLFFDHNVRETLKEFRLQNPEAQVYIVNAQPNYVSTRLNELSRSLLTGMIIVAGVLMLGMGLRVGTLVSLLLPLIAMISLAFYAMGGGVLHQISIASLVMALGILIDNVIVVVESVQEKLDAGESAIDASLQTLREFAFPLFTSTGTTVAAFLPMLGSQGDTADFTRAIPLITITTLIVSYFFAVMVTPSLSLFALKKGSVRHWPFLETLGDKIGLLAIHRPWSTLGSVGLILLLFAGTFPLVKKRFFPYADRDQLIVDIEFPAGTHLSYTEEKALDFEKKLKQFKEIKSTAAFVGRSTPRFYYNLSMQPQSPHLAQIMIQAIDYDSTHTLRHKLKKFAEEQLSDAEVIVRRLEQGPPVKAPIEIRLYSKSSADAIDAAEILKARLREIPHTENVRSDAGIGVPVARFSLTDAAAMQYSQSRSSVTTSILGRIRGISAGSYRGGEDPVPIKILSYAGENSTLNEIKNTYISSTYTGDLYLSSLAQATPDWEKSIIHRRNRQRLVSVLAELQEGSAINQVMPDIEKALTELPKSMKYEIAGEQSESAESGGELAAALPIGMTLLLFFLLLEFHSYRKMLIILITVPSAMVGIFPGLFLSGNPFGFLSLLGGMALIGIVVNNGILLLSYIEEKRSEGEDMDTAIEKAIARRIRPILLTTTTTIAGMVPLAFTSSTLWPPFAWAIISGLTTSTILALFAVPALYKVIYSRSENKRKNSGIKKTAAIFLVLLATTGIGAKEITLDEALDMAAGNSDAVIATLEAKQAREGERAQRFATYLPHVNAGGGYNYRDQDLHIETPFGDLEVGSASYLEGGITVEQNLFDPANMLYAIPAAQKDARAAEYFARQRENYARLQVVLAWSKAMEIQVRIDSMQERLRTLRNQSAEISRNYRFGRASRADLTRISTATREAEVILSSLEERYKISLQEIGWLINTEEDISMKQETTKEKATEDSLTLETFEQKLEKRPDILAADQQIEAVRKRMRAVSLEPLPQIYASGKYEYSEASLYREKGYATVTLGARLPLIQGGSRIARYREKQTELEKKEEEKKQLVRRARFELRQAWSDYSIAQNEAERYRRLYGEAAATAATERREFLQGKRSLLEVISADNIRIDWREKSRVAELDMLRALARVQFLSGENVFHNRDLTE